MGDDEWLATVAGRWRGHGHREIPKSEEPTPNGDAISLPSTSMSNAYNLSSPFSHCLETNYAPTEYELSQLKALVESPLEHLSALNVKIKHARKALEDLLAEKGALEAFISQHKALTHPIRRVPQEVIQEIFVRCLPTRHHPVLDVKTAPLSLTRVCRAWRKIAFETPRLWSELHVVAAAGPKEHVEFQLDRFKRWISLAKARPLQLSIASDTRGTNDDARLAFLEKLKPHTAKVETLELRIDDALLVMLGKHYPDPETAWPLLRKVIFEREETDPADEHMGGWSTTPFSEVAQCTFWRSPSLRTVVWQRSHGNFPALPLHWSELEEINIRTGYPSSQQLVNRYYGSVSASRALWMLRQTKMLIRLRITMAGFDERDSAMVNGGPNGQQALIDLGKPVVLDNLTTLDLNDAFLDPADHPTVFLHHLQLPALETLRYTFSNAAFADEEGAGFTLPLPADSPPLLRFLQNQTSGVRITSFTVADTSLSRAALVRCLELMPQLLHFRLEGTAMNNPSPSDEDVARGVVANDGLLDAFLPRSSSTRTASRLDDDDAAANQRTLEAVLCPCLENIQFDSARFSDEAVENFVRARLEASSEGSRSGLMTIAPLRRIAISMPTDYPPFVPRCGTEDGTHFAESALEEVLRFDLGVPEVVIKRKYWESRRPFKMFWGKGPRVPSWVHNPYEGLLGWGTESAKGRGARSEVEKRIARTGRMWSQGEVGVWD